MITEFYPQNSWLAAVNIAKHISKTGGDNGTIYPLIFLIRHAIELGLKEILDRLHKYGYNLEPFPKKVWEKHDLCYLISKVELAGSVLKLDKYEDFQDMKVFIQILDLADPTGTFGRYPRLKGGKPVSVKGNVYAGHLVSLGLKTFEVFENILTALEET